jgi:hypothetical protein
MYLIQLHFLLNLNLETKITYSITFANDNSLPTNHLLIIIEDAIPNDSPPKPKTNLPKIIYLKSPNELPK